MKTQFKITKTAIFLLHTIAWAVLFLLPVVFSGTNDYKDHSDGFKSEFHTFDTITNVFWIATFYFNSYFLVPYLFNAKKYLGYFLVLFPLFCLIIGIHNALFYLMYQPKSLNFIRAASHNLIPFLFTIASSITYRSILDRIKSENIQREKQNENLKTELSFLRSQISPHFLFNVLNNIVAMVRLKSDDLEPTVLKLSSLLQYMLYENDDEKVLVKSEVESLNNYIELQKLRISSKLNLVVEISVDEEWHSIEPMLLIPFVENAFKHGNSIVENPQIQISLNIKNGYLNFNVKNNYQINDHSKDKISGIGLANTKRRLQLLYPNKHELLIANSNGWFEVNLQMNLQ